MWVGGLASLKVADDLRDPIAKFILALLIHPDSDIRKLVSQWGISFPIETIRDAKISEKMFNDARDLFTTIKYPTSNLLLSSRLANDYENFMEIADEYKLYFTHD